MKTTLLIIAVVAFVGCGTTSWVSDPSDPQNAIVEKAIRKELKKPTGELTKADLEKVTRLHLGHNKLTEIPKGLEKLTQLKELKLDYNQLTDVKGLEKLTNLMGLSLYENLYLTKAQIAELEKALPKCSLVRNHLPVKIRMALFLEQEPGRGEPVVQLQIFRSQPRTVHVAARPVLELGKGTLEGAVLRESDEVLVFELYLTNQGRLLFQELTSRHKQQRLYVVVTRPDEERKGAMERHCIGVWLVDSTANVRVIQFTPDANESEAIKLVHDINRTVR